MSDNYLINDICKFTPVSKINIDEKKDMMVVSLFKLKGGGYKNFDKYINGLYLLDRTAKENNLILRLFIDNSIYSDKKLMDRINKLQTVSIVLYHCEKFIIDDHHIGLFGTLIRFFPLFDFDNSDTRIAIILDADLLDNKIILQKQINLYNILKKDLYKQIYFAYNGNFYNIHRNKNIFTHNDEKIYLPYCTASNIIGCQKISRKILYKFIKKLETYIHMDTIPKKILSNYDLIKKEFDKRCERNICYGVDEYFINRGLIKYLLKHKIPFLYFSIISYAHINYFKNPDSSNFVQSLINNKVFKNISEYIKKYKEYMNKIGYGKYTFKDLDEQLYTTSTEKTDFMSEYVKNIHKLIEYIEEKKYINIFDDVDIYYINILSEKKYFSLEFIKFFNIDMDDIIIKGVKI